jgi:uncharacterized protein (DUF924 family)
MRLPARACALFDFWFGPEGDPERECHREIWFESTPEFDAAILRNFLGDHAAAAAGALAHWQDGAETALALVLLLDQVPRNAFRGTPRAYMTDALARAAAERAIERGFDGCVPPAWRLFFYLPFEHSEQLADQRCGLELFASLSDRSESLEHARQHYEVIARFGRFPHRNAILGRPSTPEELAWLADHPSGF